MSTLVESAVASPWEPSNVAWRSGPCEVLGHAFELLVDDEAGFRAVLEPIVAPFRTLETRPVVPVTPYLVRVDRDVDRQPCTLYAGSTRLASGRRASDLARPLSWHINQGVIAKATGSHVLLHAAAATEGGLTVILPAHEESGKTTTVAGLLRAGFDYVTDEAVALDPVDGGVTPFPKTLSLDPGSWELFPECLPSKLHGGVEQWQVPPIALGARAHRERVPAPRVVVFPHFVDGARTRLVRLSPAAAVRQLSQNCFAFPRHAARNLRVLGAVASRATCADLVIGSLDDAVLTIEKLISEILLEEL